MPQFQVAGQKSVLYQEVNRVYMAINNDKLHKLRDGHDLTSLLSDEEEKCGVYPWPSQTNAQSPKDNVAKISVHPKKVKEPLSEVGGHFHLTEDSTRTSSCDSSFTYAKNTSGRPKHLGDAHPLKGLKTKRNEGGLGRVGNEPPRNSRSALSVESIPTKRRKVKTASDDEKEAAVKSIDGIGEVAVNKSNSEGASEEEPISNPKDSIDTGAFEAMRQKVLRGLGTLSGNCSPVK